MSTQQPQFRDKRLPEGSIYDNVDELRWMFLFGNLFTPERPIDPDEQPTMSDEGQPDLDPDSEDTTEGQSQNQTETGDFEGQGADDDDSDEGDGGEDSEDDDKSDGDSDEFDDDPDADEGDSGEGEANDNEIDPNEFDFEKPKDRTPDLPGAEVTTNERGVTTTTRTFHSWYEFVTCASDLSLRAWTHHTVLDKKEEKDGDYYATETLDQAIDMALWSGWPEGRDMLFDSMSAILPKNEYRVHHELDVAGSFPIVPVYCAGDPACMMSVETETLHNQRPIVRIDYNNTCSWMISPKAMMNLGAAVLSFAQTLEMAGYSTELRIIGNQESKRNIFRYNVTYKQAGEMFDLERAAFAVAHPSTMRRFALGLLEQHANLQHFGPDGHGYPLKEANDSTSGKPMGAIFIPPASLRCENIDYCKTLVEGAAQSLINQLQLNAA